MQRAFLFDLDGTLVDTERQNAESIAVVLAARGRTLSDEERRFVVGHGWREIYNHLRTSGPLHLSFDDLTRLAAQAKEQLCDREGLHILPGAVEFVRRASERGVCAIVSGSTRSEIAFCIRKLGLGDVLRTFVAAEDVPHGKPSPDGYLEGAARLGIAPARCLVFEDSSAGITAARAAGMRCVALAVGNFLGQDQSHADLRVHTFEDLPSTIWDLVE